MKHKNTLLFSYTNMNGVSDDDQKHYSYTDMNGVSGDNKKCYSYTDMNGVSGDDKKHYPFPHDLNGYSVPPASSHT